MGICFGVAALCMFYGLAVAVTGSGGTKFFLVWIALSMLCFVAGMLIKAGWVKRLPQALKLGAGAGCLLLLFSFFIIESLVISQMHAEGEKNLDYVIVLGAQVHESGPSVVLKYRLDKAIAYLNENPDTICIVSGGQGKNEPYSEAYGMAEYLKQNQISEERILLEPDSKTTEENILYSKTFLKEDASVGIITNDFHLFRAMQIAKKKGLSNVCGIAADSTKFYLPNNMLREYMAEIKFLLRSLIL